jgi:hypothetical protein
VHTQQLPGQLPTLVSRISENWPISDTGKKVLGFVAHFYFVANVLSVASLYTIWVILLQ